MKVVIGAILEAGNRACFGPGSPTRRRVFPGGTVGTVVAIVTTGPRSLVDSGGSPLAVRLGRTERLVESAPLGLVDFPFFAVAILRYPGVPLSSESPLP
jgi:hypothetical protein